MNALLPPPPPPAAWPSATGNVSFWYADMGGLPPPRAPLSGDTTADVCIIGAGYTGLWTAWYLKQAAPHLNILIVERDFAGFGASGRNGGWLTGGFAWNHERYAATSSRQAVMAMVAAMAGTVDEVCAVAEAQGIDADILRVDELMVAVNPAQEARMRAEVAHRQSWGDTRVSLIGAKAAADRIAIPHVRGGMVVSGMARVQPAKLVRGLAASVERAGVRIVEQTAAIGVTQGRVETTRGTVQAKIILRATEGFTAGLPGLRREWLPLNSAQIATDPLPAEMWAKIGWEGHEILADSASVYCYCQRTREGRITVGARGAPYRYGSATDSNGTPDNATIRRLIDILHRHFPVTREVGIAHAWCGVLAVPRDWCATVGFDAVTGMGFAGGYVGVGVSTSNLAGRTLADLALGRDTQLARLPWVNRRVRAWEPEPLRWLGVRGMYALLNAADRAEAQGSGPSRLAALGNWLTGRG